MANDFLNRAQGAVRAGAWALLAASAAGCAPHETPVAPSPSVERTVSTTPRDSALPPEQVMAPLLADASQRTGVAEDALDVVSASHGTWRDGSLGCPEPGMSYTQALVPGWQVIIAAGDQRLDYRLSERGFFVFCPPGRGGDIEVRDER
jgi:hypothetical protein